MYLASQFVVNEDELKQKLTHELCFNLFAIPPSVVVLRSSIASSDQQDASSTSMPFLERLINTRNRDLSLLLPLILGEASTSEFELQEGGEEAQESARGTDRLRERIVLINPSTQTVVVIHGDFDSLLREMGSTKSGQPPASKASIDAMPEVHGGDMSGECAVCFTEFGDDEGGVPVVVKEMPCKHWFHGDCIEKWLKLHGTCPVCRYEMPVDEAKAVGDYTSNSSSSNGGDEGRRGEREIWVTIAIGGGRGRTAQDSDAMDID